KNELPKAAGGTTVSFDAPESTLISYIVIDINPEKKLVNGSGDGVTFDNFSWEISDAANEIRGSDSNKDHNIFNEIAIYDLTTLEENDIILNIETLLENGQKDLFIDDGKTQLMVNGNQGDTVRLEDILPESSEQNGWAEQAGTVTIAGTQYHVWSNGDAELLVQDGVKTELV
ncbi:hypothetical protein ACWXWB_18820, partial [Pantoea dispersa]